MILAASSVACTVVVVRSRAYILRSYSVYYILVFSIFFEKKLRMKRKTRARYGTQYLRVSVARGNRRINKLNRPSERVV